MYLRVTNVKRGSRVYRYAQLVESFRGPRGNSTNRVIANLGKLDDVEIQNIRAALDASRRGQALVLPVAPSRAKVRDTLHYLDLAVLLRLWKDTGLGELVERVLPSKGRTVRASDVIAALVLQRCVAPSSKLGAERWYPTTALPEMQGISPEAFNNSRVHRSLGDLDGAEASLQDGLPDLLQSKEGPFEALFIDATDTWFVGQGPPLAHKGRDKEGIYRRRVGLILLCDQRGYPLRWHTLDGRFHDPTALLDMAKEMSTLSWTKGVPVALDRAAGHAGATQAMHEAGVLYVTALPDAELLSSGVPIPWELVDSLQEETTAGGLRARLAAAFTEAAGDRYLLDLGVFAKNRAKRSSNLSIAAAAIKVTEALEATGGSTSAAAGMLGVGQAHVRRHKALLSLIPAIRRRILDEHIDSLTLSDLIQIAGHEPDRQAAALGQLIAEPGRTRHTSRRGSRPAYPARAVVSFSPNRFIEDRRRDQENVADLEALVESVNARLAHRSNHRSDASALAEIEQRLRKHGLASTFVLHIEGTGTARRVTLRRNEVAWAQRRRGDGINVIIAHPDVPGSAEDLVARYFAKDAIEKDFQIIKSVLELRPIHHRSDPKVRAHVTVCVLALLLLRLLEARVSSSAARALEQLERVRLNILEDECGQFYTITRAGSEAGVLAQLGMTDLADDSRVQNLTPR